MGNHPSPEDSKRFLATLALPSPAAQASLQQQSQLGRSLYQAVSTAALIRPDYPQAGKPSADPPTA